MDEIKGLTMLKAVKKTTYNEVINQANRKIISSNSPNKNEEIHRSYSFKLIKNFVPKLRPKKSTFVPTPLKLNNKSNISVNFSLSKEKDDNDKQLSGNEIEILDESDSSNYSSSSMSSSDVYLSEQDSEHSKGEMLRIEPIKKNSTCFTIDKIESKDTEENDCNSFILNEVKDNCKTGEKHNKNIKLLRKKMSQIKARVGKHKFKETEEILHENFKNNFHLGIKKFEKEDDKNTLHGSLNVFGYQKMDDKKPKTRSIFEILSISKQGTKK